MKISKLDRRGAKELFHHCVVNGLLDNDRVRLAVRRVTETKPRGYVAILTHFSRLVRLDLQRRAARVESAAPLDANLQNAVQTSLARRYGPGLNVSFTQNPALLGGLRVQVGSDVYDGSIRARLDALAESF